MNRFTRWLRWHDIRLFDIPLERFHQESWLRHLMWPPLRLRLQLLYLESRLNHGGKVDSVHRWLQLDVQSTCYLTDGEFRRYCANLNRLRNRALEQSLGRNVRNHRRAVRGWLSFRQPPQPEIHIGWPRT